MIRPDVMTALIPGELGKPKTPIPHRYRLDVPEWTAICEGCARRARSWRVPPRWSRGDWFEEIRAQAVANAWRATHDFDPLRGVPFAAFVRLRVLASLRTRHRQEWAYAIHCGTKDVSAMSARPSDDPISLVEDREMLRSAVVRLPEPDRWLIEHLFWHGCTEAEVAGVLGITQQAVNKRKWVILIDLRRRIETSDEFSG